MKIKYSKTYKSTTEHLNILQERGLTILNIEQAKSHIDNIGYYRLSAYFYPLLSFPKNNHQYKANSTFDQAINIYCFDKKLRLLCFNEIEKIEIAIRSIIINTACEFYNDPFWLTNKHNFKTIKSFNNRSKKKIEVDSFNKLIINIDKEINRSKDDFIIHFSKKYSNNYPPSWIIAEVLSFGDLSKIYKGLKEKSLRKKISHKLGLNPDVFESWMQSLAGVRNICCHHSRLWNRSLPISVKNPINTKYDWLRNNTNNNKTYYRLCMIKYLLLSVAPANNFKEEIIKLLKKYPSIDTSAIGFPEDWLDEPLWK